MLTAGYRIQSAKWLDQDTIAVIVDRNLYLISLIGQQNLKQLTNSGDVLAICCSPDQRTIFFTRAHFSVTDPLYLICQVNRDGTKPQQLVRSEAETGFSLASAGLTGLYYTTKKKKIWDKRSLQSDKPRA
jgi:hypothetical protein